MLKPVKISSESEVRGIFFRYFNDVHGLHWFLYRSGLFTSIENASLKSNKRCENIPEKLVKFEIVSYAKVASSSDYL